ncbi:hypothetical protein [Spirosoma litoris]
MSRLLDWGYCILVDVAGAAFVVRILAVGRYSDTTNFNKPNP